MFLILGSGMSEAGAPPSLLWVLINTLVMAISKPPRDGHIEKRWGEPNRDGARLFFAEAGAMGLFGGYFGVALAG